MKIAIASTDKDKNSQISERGGQASYYLIFNEQGELIKTIDNPFCVGGGGAGFSVAKMLADAGVNVFVAGAVGDNMRGALEQRGVKYVIKTGIAGDAVREINETN